MSLSIVVPALNEAGNIGRCLAALRSEFDGEVLVVDGGSRDATATEAARAGAKVLAGARGLAAQCRAGAAAVTGEVILFLAADTRLAPGWRGELETALASPYVQAGGFRLAIDDPHPCFRVIEFGGNFRARYLRLSLPDQGLFIRRESYERAGGMADSRIPFARLALAVSHAGEFKLLATAARTSPRAWRERGLWTTTAAHVREYLKFRYNELPPHW